LSNYEARISFWLNCIHDHLKRKSGFCPKYSRWSSSTNLVFVIFCNIMQDIIKNYLLRRRLVLAFVCYCPLYMYKDSSFAHKSHAVILAITYCKTQLISKTKLYCCHDICLCVCVPSNYADSLSQPSSGWISVRTLAWN
jgi:hypothetical protein